MLRCSLYKNCCWVIPQSLLDACFLRAYLPVAAEYAYKAIEVGPDHALPHELPPPLSVELRSLFFVFVLHAHAATNMKTQSRVQRYQAMSKLALPDAQWLVEGPGPGTGWSPGMRRKWKPTPWSGADMAKYLYLQFENYVRLMNHYYSWRARYQRRPYKKAPEGALHIQWFNGVHRKLMSHFCTHMKLSAPARKWVNQSSPRGRFIRNYFAAFFRKRLLTDEEDGIAVADLKWVIGYSKLA